MIIVYYPPHIFSVAHKSHSNFLFILVTCPFQDYKVYINPVLWLVFFYLIVSRYRFYLHIPCSLSISASITLYSTSWYPHIHFSPILWKLIYVYFLTLSFPLYLYTVEQPQQSSSTSVISKATIPYPLFTTSPITSFFNNQSCLMTIIKITNIYCIPFFPIYNHILKLVLRSFTHPHLAFQSCSLLKLSTFHLTSCSQLHLNIH